MINNIAVVVPTVPKSREEQYNIFLSGWQKQFKDYNVQLITVFDGDEPYLIHNENKLSIEDVMCFDNLNYSDLIYNKNDGVRNLGFAYINRYMPEIDTIITLDDDVLPLGDTIGNHLEILSRKVPTSWFSTASEYMRGFPYGVREESEVVVSHGVWEGVHDYDAVTQLSFGNKPATFPCCPIPKGVLAPICGMNLAFKTKVLKHCYFSPMGYKVQMDRFADIWMGIYLKRALDEENLAIFTGGASVLHNRASNVFVNLEKEGRGLRLNETLWQGDETDPYFQLYSEKRKRWVELINTQYNIDTS